MKRTVAVAAVLLSAAVVPAWAQQDEAQALMRRSGCFKCHGIDTERLAPAYRDVAAKYRGVPDAEARLYSHLTTSPRIKSGDGEFEHTSLRGSSDAEIRGVIAWILARSRRERS